jgi:hypothetical protein
MRPLIVDAVDTLAVTGVDLTAQLLNLAHTRLDPFEHFTRVRKNEQPQSLPPTRTVQVQKRLEAQQIALLLARYSDGASVLQLTRDFRIHRTTVLAYLERHGIPRRANTRKLTDAQVAEAGVLYGQGWSLIRLGEHFGVDDETVRRSLRRIGVQLRPRRGVSSS